MNDQKPRKYAVLVNLGANDGRAARRWEGMAEKVLQSLPPDTQVHCFRPPADLDALVRNLMNEGVRGFISAGGDGSANHLLNLLMRHTAEDAQQCWLGGIGLGSSNDFIKPAKSWINGLPVRLNADQAGLADVGKAEWLTDKGETQTGYFIANASMGVTAAANWRFNHGDAVIRFLKKRFTDGAIIYAALRTILSHHNMPAVVEYENAERPVKLSNLAVLKSPFVSGSFCYDDPVQRDDGLLGVNICEDMDPIELIKVLYGLSKGRFQGRPKTLSFAVPSLSVRPGETAALELDGEVFLCRQVRFSVCPGAIRLMAL